MHLEITEYRVNHSKVKGSAVPEQSSAIENVEKGKVYRSNRARINRTW